MLLMETPQKSLESLCCLNALSHERCQIQPPVCHVAVMSPASFTAARHV